MVTFIAKCHRSVRRSLATNSALRTNEGIKFASNIAWLIQKVVRLFYINETVDTAINFRVLIIQ